MTLTLNILAVTDPGAPPFPAVGGRMVFEASGGTIGRLADNTWVLPAVSVSGHHARITWHDGAFLLEDTSRYGLCVNSEDTPLGPGRSHALVSGDFVVIGPYKIGASIASVAVANDDPFAILADGTDPPLGRREPIAAMGVGNLIPAQGARLAEEVDPLKALGLNQTPPVETGGPHAEELERSALLDQHYAPPIARRPVEPSPLPSPAVLIPDDYDPLAESSPSLSYPASPAAELPTPTPEAPINLAQVPPSESSNAPAPEGPIALQPLPLNLEALFASEVPVEPPPVAELPVDLEALLASETPVEAPSPPPLPVERPPLPELPVEPPPVAELPVDLEALFAPEAPVEPTPELPSQEQSGLAAVLAGAGLNDVTVTPEFARSLGRVLRVVVSGVMDVLRAREDVKDTFRIPQTRLMPSRNNPLKLSVDADDALFNLLVKHNAAYLGPVEAFEDAFDDLRDHQLAELEGMQIAFQSIVAELGPDRLEGQFDRQIKTASILPLLNKTLYWDLYRDRVQQITADPDKSFRALFVERFGQAYETRRRRLKEQRREVEGN